MRPALRIPHAAKKTARFEKEYIRETAARKAAQETIDMIDAYWKMAKTGQIFHSLEQYSEQLTPQKK